METGVFSPADVLLPQGADFTKWSVVACDQYTSEPGYWSRVETLVGDSPSTLRLTLPEVYLSDPRLAERRAAGIRAAMKSYLQSGLLKSVGERYVLVRRTLRDGRVRTGLVGKVDLSQYDYRKGARPLVRATEGTVLSRLPPRVRIRRGAPLEVPHILLLMDDPDDAVFGPLNAARERFEKLYDFPLMEQSGHLRGFAVDEEAARAADAALAALGAPERMKRLYDVDDRGVLMFAVGDGNHSLAAAKACYDELRGTMSDERWRRHPARWAMVELENLHDPTLRFEPIHRVLFGVSADDVLAALGRFFRLTDGGRGQAFTVLSAGARRRVGIGNPCSALTVGSLQAFLDDYTAKTGARLDYIHGADVAEKLTARPGNVGFLLPEMGKDELFRTVLLDGALPRKTFSMGQACDKRFYLECRRITGENQK